MASSSTASSTASSLPSSVPSSPSSTSSTPDRAAGLRGLLSTGSDDVALTNRELTVLDGVARGMTNREIADELFLSVDTVKTHARRLYAKLGVSNRTQAAMRGRWRTDLPSALAASPPPDDQRFAWGDRVG